MQKGIKIPVNLQSLQTPLSEIEEQENSRPKKSKSNSTPFTPLIKLRGVQVTQCKLVSLTLTFIKNRVIFTTSGHELQVNLSQERFIIPFNQFDVFIKQSYKVSLTQQLKSALIGLEVFFIRIINAFWHLRGFFSNLIQCNAMILHCIVSNTENRHTKRKIQEKSTHLYS